MVKIYILKLEHGKFYVGKSESPYSRITKHFEGAGAQWPRQHHPVEIEEIFDGDAFDEDKTTLQLMEEYGVENVRGGTFSRPRLTRPDRAAIGQMLQGASDRCFVCGEAGHFAADCDDEEWSCNYCAKTFTSKKGAIFHENVHCVVAKRIYK